MLLFKHKNSPPVEISTRIESHTQKKKKKIHSSPQNRKM